jgi:hypothetical protein
MNEIHAGGLREVQSLINETIFTTEDYEREAQQFSKDPPAAGKRLHTAQGFGTAPMPTRNFSGSPGSDKAEGVCCLLGRGRERGRRRGRGRGRERERESGRESGRSKVRGTVRAGEGEGEGAVGGDGGEGGEGGEGARVI